MKFLELIMADAAVSETDREAASCRPYRSHLQPACDECRRGKTRCIIKSPGEPCEICRKRHIFCHFTSSERKRADEEYRRWSEPQAKRRRVDTPGARGDGPDGLSRFPSIVGASPNESSVLLNPTMAEDVEVLEHYLTSRSPSKPTTSKLYNTISNAPGNPIVYLTVPRRRKGLESAVEPGRTQREILEQILGPLKDELVNVYFHKIHPCFPVIDEKTFFDLWRKNSERISSALLCNVYASALVCWDSSELLRQHPRPDSTFAWNQSATALQDDYMAPTISTVHATLIAMIGRPVIGVTDNIVNSGRTSTLAASLGLHRNPCSWRATAHEKNVRIRLWWGVLINDYWSSFAHGTPPTITTNFFDVPLPALESLLPIDASERQRASASTFLHLCSLTQILGIVLPIVYSLRTEVTEFWRVLRRLECTLDDWADDLPHHLNLSTGAPESHADGSSSLWFCFLSAKLLLGRLAFRATLTSPEKTVSEAKQYRLAMLRELALNLTDFVIALNKHQLQEFWLPYASHLLVSATTTLLRCTVETGDHQTKLNSVSKLQLLHRRLQIARDDFGWDLASFCLERCGDAIEKLARLLRPQHKAVRNEGAANELNIGRDQQSRQIWERAGLSPILNPEVFLPVDSLDFPWETLWDASE